MEKISGGRMPTWSTTSLIWAKTSSRVPSAYPAPGKGR